MIDPNWVFENYVEAAKMIDALREVIRLKAMIPQPCDVCEGAGRISFNPNLHPDSFPGAATMLCSRCQGTGTALPQIEPRSFPSA